jgi:long-chain acyl-CoA synthetase
MKLLQQFIQNAANRPSELYLKDDNSEMSYRETITKIQNCRFLLQEKGVSPGCKILILSSNDNSFVVSILSILLEGGIAIPVSLESTESEINTIISESKTQVIIGPTSYIKKDSITKLNYQKENYITRESFMADHQIGTLAKHKQIESTDIYDNTTRLILFTSGSEGIPKGVCLSGDAISYTIELCTNDFWNIKKTDNILMLAPSQTIFGITMTLVSALSGAGLRLMSNFNPQIFIQTLVDDKITFFAGVPTLAELLLKLEDRIPKSALSLKKVLIAGAPLPEITEKKIENNFGLKIITGYGMTEGVPMAYRNEFELNYPARTVGKVAIGCQLKIIDDNKNQVPLNTDGEIIVRGEQIFSGYVSEGKTDDSCFEEGWFRTGDIGRLDNQGYLFISGRKSDMIKRSGYRVFPSEIENAIMKIEGVSNCAVIGIVDKTRGEKIIAFITCNEVNISAKEISTILKLSLSSYKIPNEVFILNELPKTIAGKTDKLLLKENYLNSKY